MWKRKSPWIISRGLNSAFFVAANEGRTDPPPRSVKLFIAYKRLLCQEKYFLLLA
nr:MAG TPA: hypothetical protein [Caudoviricetes sp.]DAG63247.1 MAG TPA: hypothetical protein [Caudoviricetes sp.]